ncbi:helix-turn-helix domain-containing protein [Priestia koreensis]|uniref:helix-turn-helix domain-containing protein n=1 Tax=Priestia koreensis TaxID=284581 RepID=UPI001F57261E|nr:helix-turn-helix domain-containing protein [Priestia koreensis]UNL84047.1 helix-turn-helix domain-containing protein [Priestia koreensis]
MNDLAFIILYCVHKLKEERTIFGAYHLLAGKKSSQTIQDGQLYGLSHLFRAFSYLDKKTFSVYVQQLEKEACIEEIADGKYRLTPQGLKELQHYLQETPIPPALNGWTYANVSRPFYQRLLLLVQTMSNLQYKESHFIPLINDASVLSWMKRFLTSVPLTREQWASHLYEELTMVLSTCSQEEADIFVKHLTGHKRIAFTKLQIAEQHDISVHRVHLLHLSVVHHMLKYIADHRNELTVLHLLVDQATIPLTTSTMQTYELLKKGHDLQTISRIRRLKPSTIEDHLVELALFIPDFSIDPYVKTELVEEIKEITERLQTNKLKEIKETTSYEVSYFQIRLILAKLSS